MKRALVTVAVLTVMLADVGGAATTRLDEHGTVLLNDRKVFPIVLAKGPQGARTPTGADALDEVVAAGVNFLKVGPSKRPWWPEDLAEAIGWNRQAAARGIHTWVNLSPLSNAKPGSLKETRLREVVTALESDPSAKALGMWKGADEPWLAGFPPAELQFAYCIATSRGEPTWCGGRAVADEEHLWVTIQAPRGTASDLTPYGAVTDIQGVHYYPVTFATPDPDLHGVGTWTDSIRSVTPRGAAWTTLQVCAGASSGPSGSFVLPTRRQERYMIYDAIINGARSLAFYGGNLTRCWSPTDTAYGWNWTFWNAILEDLIREINAASPIAPALLNPGSTRVLESTSATTQVIVRQGATESELWVFAARHGPGTESVTITGLPEGVERGTVYTELRSIEVTNGAFTDTFSRSDVHVYHFTVPPPSAPSLQTRPAPARPTALRAAHASSGRSRLTFTRRVRVVTDAGSQLTTGVVRCAARVRRTALRVAGRGWRNGSAYCTWRVPRTARGGTLRGVMRIDSQRLSLKHRFIARA